VLFPQWLGLVLLLLMWAVLWQVRQVLLILFAAIVLANGLNHLSQWFEVRGLSRRQGLLLAIASLGGGLILVVALIIPPFLSQLHQLFTLIPESFEQLMTQLRQWAAQGDQAFLELLPSQSQLGQQLQPLVNQIAGRGLNVFYNTLAIPLGLLLLIVLSVMLLADPGAYRRGLIRFFPAFYRPRLSQILTRAEVALEIWLKTLLFNIFSISILSFFALSLLQVRLPLAQALLAGLLTLIPTIGPLVSLLTASAIAFLDSPFKALAIMAAYSLIQHLDHHYLSPHFVRQPLPLLRGLLLLAQVFFASVFGVLGLILAVPLTLVSQVLIQEIVLQDILDCWYQPQEES
jgi:predicted PurR-regulated permease PerM